MFQKNFRDIVTILILLETLLQLKVLNLTTEQFEVTILILLETLLQQKQTLFKVILETGHNPYFTGNSFTTVPKISLNLAKNCKKACDFQP